MLEESHQNFFYDIVNLQMKKECKVSKKKRVCLQVCTMKNFMLKDSAEILPYAFSFYCFFNYGIIEI